MPSQCSRVVFDKLLAKTHVQHALVQFDGRYNELPADLATLLFLDETPDRLQATYSSVKCDLAPWKPSPRNIADEESKARFLGDVRFQRAFMTYFSMENGRFSNNAKTLATSHLFTGPKPLLYGLFSGGIGRPLTLLADGIELRAAILVMQSLTLSAVDWMDPFHELLTHPHLASPPPTTTTSSSNNSSGGYLSPENILHRVAYDGRFSGVMKAGPGFHGAAHVFASPPAQAALLESLRCLDARDVPLLLQQLAALAALLLCATHKPGGVAFDLYLGRLVTCVNSARVVLGGWVEEGAQRVLFVRGLWLLVVLTYVTQLRPVVDGKLLVSKELAEEGRGWEAVFGEVGERAGREGVYPDLQFLRALRSLRELSRVYGTVHGRLYLHAAWKLVKQWQGWTGLGSDREAMLNIRL